MPLDFVVRPATRHDLEETAVLFDLYRQFYKMPADLAGASRYLNERLANKDSVIWIAVTPNNGGVGFLQLYSGFSSLNMSRTWILNDLYVREDYRRHKIAAALIESAHAYARSTGATSIALETQPNNKVAQTLYEKLGYKVENDFLMYVLALT